MDELERRALTQCQVELVRDLMPEQLYGHLLQEGIFTKPMLESIQYAGSKSEQTRKLLRDLPTRGCHAFEKFLKCLRSTGHVDCADKLESKRAALRRENNWVPPSPSSMDVADARKETKTQSELEEMAVNQCFVQLQQEISFTPEFESYLLEEGIFTESMLEVIKYSGTPTAQNRQLLMDLPRRGPLAFKKFLNCLRATSHDHLATRLKITRDLLMKDCNYVASPPAILQSSASAQDFRAAAVPAAQVYEMIGAERCRVLIAHNHFENISSLRRDGTDADKDRLVKLFEEKFRFTCKDIKDWKADDLIPKVTSYFSQGPAACSLILVIMTHGKEEVLIGENYTEVPVMKVIDSLQLLDAYKGKPKMVVIQACRGDNVNPGVCGIPDCVPERKTTSEETDGLLPNGPGLWSDTIILYATVPGFVSIRHPEKGSWFINDFCTILDNNQSIDVNNLTIKMNKMIAERSSTNADASYCQISQSVATLTRKWWLNHAAVNVSPK